MSHGAQLDHFLTAEELQELQADHLPSLLVLNERYTKNIDPVGAFPVTPIYLDCLRTSWRLDSLQTRPSERVAIEGLGFAFGLLLSVCTDLRWALAKDDDGHFLAMAKVGDEPALVLVPPFSFVAKRHAVENAEVFLHFFEQTPAPAIGFRKPKNWLLEGDA